MPVIIDGNKTAADVRALTMKERDCDQVGVRKCEPIALHSQRRDAHARPPWHNPGRPVDVVAAVCKSHPPLLRFQEELVR